MSAAPDAQHIELAVQIGFAARFDLDELEAETLRFFMDDEATLGDPFAEDAHLRTIHTKILQFKNWDSFWSQPRALLIAGFPFRPSYFAG